MSDTPDNFTLNDFTFFLQHFDRDQLPGMRAHLELTPYRAGTYRQTDGKIKVPQNARMGAVAIILSFYYEQPILVLTKRVDYKGVHGGQISFPGGKQEPGDKDLLETAIRETREETGVDLRPSEFIMPLSEIYIPPSNFHVFPYLFMTEREMVFNINNEVDYPILAELDLLTEPGSFQTTSLRLSDGFVIDDAPCFVYGKEIIWGATAAMLNELKWLWLQFKNRSVR